MKKTVKEYRCTEDGHELRMVSENGKDYLQGYGIVFNSNSRKLYGWFIERILPESLDTTDMSEIVCKHNHDINRTLGTTWGGTLTWGKDSTGVWYRCEIDTSLEIGREVKAQVERGDLRGSSFEFVLAEEGRRWKREKIGGVEVDVREVTNIAAIYDLSPVVRPAYPATEGTISMYKRDIEESMPPADVPPPKKWYEL